MWSVLVCLQYLGKVLIFLCAAANLSCNNWQSCAFENEENPQDRLFRLGWQDVGANWLKKVEDNAIRIRTWRDEIKLRLDEHAREKGDVMWGRKALEAQLYHEPFWKEMKKRHYYYHFGWSAWYARLLLHRSRFRDNWTRKVSWCCYRLADSRLISFPSQRKGKNLPTSTSISFVSFFLSTEHQREEKKKQELSQIAKWGKICPLTRNEFAAAGQSRLAGCISCWNFTLLFIFQNERRGGVKVKAISVPSSSN